MPTKELARLKLRIEADTSRLKSELTIVEGQTRRTGNRMERAFARAGRAAGGLTRSVFSLRGAIGLLAGGGALIFGLRLAADRIAEFGESISELEAIAQPTAEQLAELERRARDLGAATVFSANEAAKGMVFLARAGFEVEDILAAIGPALNLAAAGNLDLAAAADIVSNVMQAFQRPASETTRFVDVLAKTAASANTDVAMLGEAMKTAAPVANAFGVSVEQASAAIAVLSNAGLQGQLAGTGLRRVITELASPTETLRNFLGGASLAGNGLVGVMNRLAESSLTGADAIDIFGQRGGPAFLVLREGAADLEEFVASLEDAGGTAQRIADTRLDNLRGSFRLLDSAVNELILTLGEGGLTQFLRDTADQITRIAQSGKAVELMREFGETFKFIVENRQPILATLAGLVAFSSVGRVNPIAGLLAGLVVGGAAFIALGDDLLSAADAAALLAEKMALLEKINQDLASENFIESLRPGLLETRRRVLTEILELEQAIAAASREPDSKITTPPTTGGAAGGGGGTVGAAPTKALAEVEKLITSVALLERQIDAASGEVSTLVNERDIQRVEQLVAGLGEAARIDLAKTLDEAGFAGANLEESLRLLIATERESREAVAAGSAAFADMQRVFEQTRNPAERYADTIARLEALKQRGLDQEAFNRAVARASEGFIEAARAAEQLKLGTIEVGDAFGSLGDAGAEAMDELIAAAQGFGREFSRTMAEALVTGDLTFKGLGQSFLVNFAEKVIQQRLTDPLFGIFEGFLDSLSFGGGGASSTALSLTGPRFTFAEGGIVERGAVHRFARGGVVEHPTLFRLAHGAGLMGEAGPEGILPLARLPGGDLGVKTTGGGGGVTITIVNNTGAPAETRESRRGNRGRDIEIVIGQMVSRDIRSGGETFRAVRETFNLTPATALR